MIARFLITRNSSHHKGQTILVLAGVIGFLSCVTAHAYDTVIHAKITEKARELVAKGDEPIYREFQGYEAQMKQGSIEEDEPVTRGSLHFYNPLSGRGLTLGLNLGVSDTLVTFSSARDIAFTNNASGNAMGGSNWWKRAVDEYKIGNKSGAYLYLGHALHLLTQDMAQPCHVHNDAHLPHQLGIVPTFILQGDDAPYESYVTAHQNSSVFLGATQVKDAATPTDLSDSMALFAFSNSMYPVTGSGTDSAGNSFVTIQVGAHSYKATFITVRDPEVSSLVLSVIPHYKIVLPSGGSIYYWPSLVPRYGEDGGPRFDFGNDFWEVVESAGQYFFDRTDQVYVDAANSQTINEQWINRFIVPSIEHSAGLMKLFANEVDSLPAKITMKDGSDVVPEGGIIANHEIQIHASDVIVFEQPMPSGIYEIGVKGPGFDEKVPFDGVVGLLGSNGEDATFSNLPNGSYTCTVLDGMNNPAISTFIVEDCVQNPNSALCQQNCSSKPNSQSCVNSCKNNPNGTACRNACNVDPNSAACRQACQINPNSAACKDACNNDPNSLACRDACKVDPNSAACRRACEVDANSLACQDVCTLYPNSLACRDTCTLHPSSPGCIQACWLDPMLPWCVCSGPGCSICSTQPYAPGCPCANNPNLPSCPPMGGTNSDPAAGVQMQDFICENHAVYKLSLTGDSADSCDLFGIGGLGIPGGIGRATVSRNFTITKGNDGIRKLTVCDASKPSGQKCKAGLVNLRIPVCVRSDPTFLGGFPNEFDPAQFEAHIPAFSPGVAGSLKRIFNQEFVVAMATAEVSVAIVDSSSQTIRQLMTGERLAAGLHSFTWDGANDSGVLQPEGVYTFVLRQRSLEDPSRIAIVDGNVAIDNTVPFAAINEIAVSEEDPTILNVFGSASDINLMTYSLAVAPSEQGPFTTVGLVGGSVIDGQLGGIDTSAMAVGSYVLKVTALDRAGLEASVTSPLQVLAQATGALRVIIGTTTQSIQNLGGATGPLDNPTAFVDEGLPTGAGSNGHATAIQWADSFAPNPIYSGTSSHTDLFTDGASGPRFHYFIHANPGRLIKQGENLIQYVYLHPSFAPQEILLQFYTDSGNGEHRVFWGNNLIQTGANAGTEALNYGGSLPPAGQWVRLKIPASALGLEGKVVKGIAYGTYGGRAWWDKSTTSVDTLDIQKTSALVVQTQTQQDDQTSTTVTYTLPHAGAISIDVFAQGTDEHIKRLFSGTLSSGVYSVTWNQTNDTGTVVSDGSYYMKFSAPDRPVDSEAIVFAGATTISGAFAASVTDANGNVYRVDASRHEITKETAAGYRLTTFGKNDLQSPIGVALDPQGNVLVQDGLQVTRFDVGRHNLSLKSLTATIRVPWDKALVKATVPIIGAAAGRNFDSYTVDIGQGWNPSTFTFLNRSVSEVLDNFVFPTGQNTVYGNLATWETGLVPGEEYPSTDIFHPPLDQGYRGRWTVRLNVRSKEGFTLEDRKHLIVGRVINNANGGPIVSDDAKAVIIVSPLSLRNDWDIFGFVTATTTAPAFMPPLPQGLVQIGSMYELRPEEYRFYKPVEYRAYLDPSDLAGYPGLFANKIGLYQFDETTMRWIRLPSLVGVVNSTSTPNRMVFSNQSLMSIQSHGDFFALFADTTTPVTPRMDPIASPTHEKHILVSGSAEPYSSIMVRLTTAPFTVTSLALVAQTDSRGIFQGNLLLPVTGHYELTVQSSDEVGNLSATSPAMAVDVLGTPPAHVTSIAFKGETFGPASPSTVMKNTRIYLEMQADDIDPTRRDTVYARLSSSLTDPTGILVPLIQTDLTAPFYRGGADLGSFSEASILRLGALSTGETIRAVAEADASVSAQATLATGARLEPPDIFSATHPSALQQTFERGLGSFGPFTQAGAEVVLDTTTAASGTNSIRITQKAEHGDFSVRFSEGLYDLRENPIVAFDYKLPSPATRGRQGVPPMNLYFRRNGVVHEVTFTSLKEPIDAPPTMVHLGSIRPLVAGYLVQGSRFGSVISITGDDQWHHMEFNLLSMFKNRYPDDASFTVDQVFAGDWTGGPLYSLLPGETPIGDSLYLDNVMLRNGGRANTNPVFTWSTPETAADGYSVVLDMSSNTVPAAVVTDTEPFKQYANLPNGPWYFHARSRDTAGVWSPAGHFLINVDIAPPMFLNPDPPPTLPLTRTEQLTARVVVQDSAGLDMDSLRFSINGSSYNVRSGGVTYDVTSGSLTILITALRPVAPQIRDGDVVTVRIDDAADLAGNHIAQPFSWSWQADFTRFAGSDFAPVTFNGGKDAAWSTDSSHLAFASDRFGSDDLFVIDADAFGNMVESAASLHRLTSGSANENQPVWSPDGHRLIYVSDVEGTKDLWMMNSDGSGAPVRLTTTEEEDEHPTWLPDGSRVIFTRSTNGYGNLWAIDLDTATWTKTGEHAITQEGLGYNREARTSSDGKSLIYRRSLYVDNIARIQSDGSAQTPVTATGKDTSPAWSPDDRQIVFATTRESPASQLWLMDADGGNVRKLLDNQGIFIEKDPAWSADGGRIAFTTTRGGSPNIWVLSVLQVNGFNATPTPFSPVASPGVKDVIDISYRLSASSANVKLDLLAPTASFNRSFIPGVTQNSGEHHISWDGRRADGEVAQDGEYILRLTVTGSAALDPIIRQISFEIDNAPPDVRLTASSGSGGFYNPTTLLGLHVEDAHRVLPPDLGVDTTQQFSPYTGVFSLPAGPHRLSLRAQDAAGNVTVVPDVQADIDDRAPISSVTYQGAFASSVSSRTYISSTTAFTVSAVDDSTAAVISGVKLIIVQRGNFAYASGGDQRGLVFVPAIGPTEGEHELVVTTYDIADNRDIRFTPLFLDATPPEVFYQSQPELFFNGSHYFASTTTELSILAQDPVSNGDASGIDRILLSKDGGAFVVTTSSLSFDTEGDHRLVYLALDRVENTSPLQALNVIVDNNPPTAVLQVSTPVYTAGSMLTGATHYVSALTRFSLGVAEGASAPDRLELAVDGGSYQTLGASAFVSISNEGQHSIAFRAIRSETPERSDTYDLITDTTPPVTTAQFGVGFSTTFIRPDTFITLFSTDAASGVGAIYYVLDGSTFTYAKPFSLGNPHGLAGGHHTLAWFSRDRVDNEEVPKRLAFSIDNVAPSVALQLIGGHQYQDDGANRLYASGDTGFAIIAADPDGSGVARIEVDRGNGQGFQLYTTTFTLSGAGRTVIQYRASDQTGNTSSVNRFTVYSDASAPPTSAVPTLPVVVVGSVTYARSATLFNFVTPEDSLSGLATVRVFKDGLQAASPVQFLTEGPHFLSGVAVDRVGNISVPPFELPLIIDDSPPTSTLILSSVTLVSGSTIYVPAEAVISISATDYFALTQQPGVGIGESRISLDFGAEIVVSSGMALPEGSHRVQFYSVDRLGNREVARTQTLVVAPSASPIDHLPPQTSIVFSSPVFISDGFFYYPPSTQVSFFANDPGNEASGVAVTRYSVDNGTWTVYSGPLTFAEGPHSVAYQSEDRAGNLEPLQASLLSIDATAPVTTLTYSGGLLVSTQTFFVLTAVDPLIPEATSGVMETRISIDDAPFVVYFEPIVFVSSGSHTLKWFSRDFVGNAEKIQQASITLVDLSSIGAPPVATLLSPAAAAEGIDQVFARALIPVIGSAGGTNITSWVLSYAPGQHAVSGFKSIAQSSAAVTGILGIWDARSLNGFYTLRLVVSDANQQSAAETVVFIGDPDVLAIFNADDLGNARNPLSQATGIAVDDRGVLTILNSNSFEVTRYDAQGKRIEETTLWTLPQDQRLDRSAVRSKAKFTYRIDVQDSVIRKTDPSSNEVLVVGPKFDVRQIKAIALDATSALYVLDRSSARILKFGLAGPGEQTKIIRLDGDGTVALAAPAPDADFHWGEVFVYPNPARGGTVPTLHIEVGIADRVTIKIYNVAGQQLVQQDLLQAPAVIDSGNGPQYAYEYSWAGHIASGVYLYHVEAEKSGVRRSRRGKFAVVR